MDREKIAGITPEQIRAFRLRAHHLDRKLPPGALEAAASVCGFQNSPPGAWETALWNRVEGCTLQAAQDALYREKRLLQAWSVRGAPLVFPAAESGVFLAPLAAAAGETPWIYTRGITAALDFLGMAFDDLLPLVLQAAEYLETHTVTRKEALDAALAEIVEAALPAEKLPLWRAPSMYGPRQTVGGAVVSFMLRPCAFRFRVVFGARDGIHPMFTSFRCWTGHMPAVPPDAEKRLVQKFLHAHGPANVSAFGAWLGCCPQQAKRLWQTAAAEMEPVRVAGRTRYVLAEDLEALRAAEGDADAWRLLGPHDPYLDFRDRALLLEDVKRQRAIWQTVSNPGVLLRGGRVAGVWRQKLQKTSVAVEMTLFEPADAAARERLEAEAAQYAAFRGVSLRACTFRAEA